jgi:hypothetical protein
LRFPDQTLTRSKFEPILVFFADCLTSEVLGFEPWGRRMQRRQLIALLGGRGGNMAAGTRSLGLSVPANLLALSDRVVE